MTGLPDLIGLLYRADWTRLSLSAELRAEYGQEPPPRSPCKYRSRWYRDWPGQRRPCRAARRRTPRSLCVALFMIRHANSRCSPSGDAAWGPPSQRFRSSCPTLREARAHARRFPGPRLPARPFIGEPGRDGEAAASRELWVGLGQPGQHRRAARPGREGGQRHLDVPRTAPGPFKIQQPHDAAVLDQDVSRGAVAVQHHIRVPADRELPASSSASRIRRSTSPR